MGSERHGLGVAGARPAGRNSGGAAQGVGCRCGPLGGHEGVEAVGDGVVEVGMDDRIDPGPAAGAGAAERRFTHSEDAIQIVGKPTPRRTDVLASADW